MRPFPSPPWVSDARRKIRRRRTTASVVGVTLVGVGVIRVSSGLDRAVFVVGACAVGAAVGLFVWLNIWWGAMGAKNSLSGENHLVYDISDMDHPRLVVLSLSGKHCRLTASPWDEGSYLGGVIESCEVHVRGSREAYVRLDCTTAENAAVEIRLRGKRSLVPALSRLTGEHG